MERSCRFLLGVIEDWVGERYDLSIFYKLPLAAVLKIDGGMCGQSSSRQACEEAASDASARAVGARSTVVTMAMERRKWMPGMYGRHNPPSCCYRLLQTGLVRYSRGPWNEPLEKESGCLHLDVTSCRHE